MVIFFWLRNNLFFYFLKSVFCFHCFYYFLIYLFLSNPVSSGRGMSNVFSVFNYLVMNKALYNIYKKNCPVPIFSVYNYQKNLIMENNLELLNFKRKIWTWTGTRTLAWRSTIELSRLERQARDLEVRVQVPVQVENFSLEI